MNVDKKQNDGLGKQVPPRALHVAIYFLQKGMLEQEAIQFYSSHESINWKNADGNPIQNWKTVACQWIWDMQHG